MSLAPLALPAGIRKVDSANAAGGRWIDSDKIRFVGGFPEKWAGIRKLVASALLGKVRASLSWANQFGNTNAGFGSHLKLYALTGNDSISDITPIRASSTINNNPFAMQNGSAVVTVTDTAHGADDGDFVTYSGATAAHGITIVGEYQLTRIDADSYTITHSIPATSTGSGGGASVVAAYQINIGLADTVVGTGWGAGTWGTGTWGTPRTDGIELNLRRWSLAEFANNLLASPSEAGLYLWEETTDARAEVVTNAPTFILAMFVTGERFVFALGSSVTTPMTVSWPDQDDITDWTPSAANTANTRTLQSGSKLIAGTVLTDAVSLVWSDTSLYIFQYTGSDFIYDSRLAGTNCGLAGSGAFAKVSGIVFWMSGQDFHMYAGAALAIPNSADIHDFVFADMDASQIAKTWCVYDQKNGQIRWGYCSNGASEPDKYVDVSLDGFHWTVGTLDCTTATLFRPSETSALMVDASSFIYELDVGSDLDGAAMQAYLTSGLSALQNGEVNLDIMGFVPDFQRQTGAVAIEMFTRERPNSQADLDAATVSMAPGSEIEDFRLEGRLFGFTVRSNVLGGDFRLGLPQVEIQRSGMRR